MTQKPPPVPLNSNGRSLMQSLSIVWIIPFLALALALGVAFQSYNDRGPIITIEFENGSGIAPRETDVRFRDVKIGIVEDISFSPDLSSVIAQVRIDKDVAPFIDAGASFWVVRPQLTAQGVTGLDTVISGVFIEGSWDSDIGPLRNNFKGLDTAPLYRPGKQGLQIALRSIPGGTLSDNTPILYRGIEVGRVGPARISSRGNYAIAEAIIYEPHGRLVTSSTRFWDTSGFTVSIGPNGAEVDFSSLASLVGGGVTFDTFVSGGPPVADGTTFEVFEEAAAARNSVFNASEVELLEVRVIFDDNISGLALGAPVELSGLRIGSVENLSGIVDRDIFGDSRVRLSVVLGIQPARLGLQGDVTPETALAFLSDRVQSGLRARLASGNLLTGGLKVELVDASPVAPAQISVVEGAIPTLPSTGSEISDASATVEGVFSRINSLPIEELLVSATRFMEGAAALINSEDMRQTPQDLRSLVGEIRTVVTSSSVQDIPITLNVALGRLDTILAQIEEEQAIARVLAVVDSTADAAQSVGASVAGVTGLVEALTGVAETAENLPLDELTQQLTAILGSADAVISAPATQELPASLAGALDELNATLAELRAGGAVENVNATLQSTRQAADAVALSSRDLPALVARITQVFDEASATIAGYNRGDVLSRDAQAALRDISQASDAITSLARLLERNPSALIRGR
ncbi:MAG: intermembrane transport protein PqiB [Roseobacter sp.]